MDNKNQKTLISGITLSLDRRDFKLPQELRNFLSEDDQGIEGLDFMLRDSKLFRRVPTEVSHQYHTLYSDIDIQLEKSIQDLQSALDEIKANPKDVIHIVIQSLYEGK